MNLRDRVRDLFDDDPDDLEMCCDSEFEEHAIDPDNLPYHILFSDSVSFDGVVDREAVEEKARAYRELFGGT